MSKQLLEVVKKFLEIEKTKPPMATGPNPYLSILMKAVEDAEKSKAQAIGGYADLRMELTLKQMRYNLLQIIPELTDKIEGSIELAVEQTLKNYDFQGEIAKRVQKEIHDEIFQLVSSVWHKYFRNNENFRKKIEERATKLIKDEIAQKMGIWDEIEEEERKVSDK